VVQLYVRSPEPKVDCAIKDLRGFCRVTLTPNQRRAVTFELRPRDLARYSPEQKRFVVEPGEYEILVGASSADIRQSLEVTVQ
jgi:beta-glucosidase